MSFIISVAEFSQSYPKNEFTNTFPGSMITAALDQDPSAEEISLDPKLVSSEALLLLHQIITTQDYPYVSDSKIQRQLDYLGIDLPPVVYMKKYDQFLHESGLRLADVKGHYPTFMKMAFTLEFPELATYALTHTEDHAEDITLFHGHFGRSRCRTYSEANETILMELLIHRPYLKLTVSDYRPDDIACTGYVRIFRLLVPEYIPFGTGFVGYTLIGLSLMRILKNPECMEQHLEMINHLYVNHRTHLHTIDLTSMQVIQAVLGKGPPPNKYNRLYIPSLLYIAVLSGVEKELGSLFEQGGKFVPTPRTGRRDPTHHRKIPAQIFLDNYSKRPSLWTPERISLISKYMTPEQLDTYRGVLSP